MLPIVGVSQRVSIVVEYGERRDAVDQRWAAFLAACGVLPLYIPNHPSTVVQLLQAVPFAGFVLTGGNSLVAYGGDAPERDEIERLLVDHALNHQKPLIGVCRGMQVLQHNWEVPLKRVVGHVAVEHAIQGEYADQVVNSYHNFGTKLSHPDLIVKARASDGTVEVIRHVEANIHGIMWHPERYAPFRLNDIEFFTTVLCRR